MDEYTHVSIHNMNVERREKERRQQHYSDQARIAELEAALFNCITPSGLLMNMDASAMRAHIISISILAERMLVKG